jgi:type IV pilus assembly protein PilC
MGYLTTQVTEALPGINFEGFFGGLTRIGTEDMVLFNIQFSNMIQAGLSILTCLHTLAQQTENKKLKEILASVARSVEAGSSLSDSFSRTPSVFSKLFVNMIRAGEASGKLDVLLSRYAVYHERQADLRQKINGALFYPAILLTAGLGVTLFIVTQLIPQFVEIFLRAGVKLPFLTSALYQFGMFLKHFWLLGVFFTLAAAAGLRWVISTERGRWQFDRLKLSFPIISFLSRKAALSRFSRTLGTLLASGVPILQSLDITKDVIGNEVLAGVVLNARRSVEAGKSLSEPLRISGEFPPDVVEMIKVGEETGDLDEMLDKISDLYDKSIGYSIKKITTLIEPILLAVLGCLVGFIMASMLLPIFDMIKVMRH